MDYILEEMKQLDADGVDFFLLKDVVNSTKISAPVASYTKEQCEKGGIAYPRTPKKFWKTINGKKVYYNQSKSN